MKKTTQTEQDKANGYSDIGYNAPQHTPGQWQTGAMMTRVEVLPQGWRMPMLIADCHGKHSPESEAERVANARLIAAAPDMLAALQQAEKQLAVAYNPDRLSSGIVALCRSEAQQSCNQARAAIAKATN